MTVDHQFIAAVNIAIAALFLPFLLIGTTATIVHAVQTRREKRAIPIILKRDIISRTCLTLPIAGLVLIRALGLNLSENLAWVLGSGVLFVVSVGTYAFFEVFVVERPSYYERQRGSEDRP